MLGGAEMQVNEIARNGGRRMHGAPSESCPHAVVQKGRRDYSVWGFHLRPQSFSEEAS